MDNVWNSIKEGLAGAGGFLLDVLGKAGAYLNTSNAYGVHNNQDYKTLKMNDKEKFSQAAHQYIYDKNIDNNRKRFQGLPLKDSLRAQIDDYTDFQTQLNAEIKGAQEDYEKYVRYRQADEKWFPISDDYNKKSRDTLMLVYSHQNTGSTKCLLRQLLLTLLLPEEQLWH